MRRRHIAWSLVVVAVSLLLAASSWAQDLGVGSRVELKATNPLGVPLHRQPRPSLFGRAADGTVGTVIGLQNEGRWPNLILPDGRVAGYVSHVLSERHGGVHGCV